MVRTLLCKTNHPKNLWAEAVCTSCYILNRCLIRPMMNKTPYEIWKGRKPNINYFHAFGCKCCILNIKDSMENFDAKTDEGIFLGYSSKSKAYIVYNKTTRSMEETMLRLMNLISLL